VTTDKTVTRVPSHFDGVVKRLKFRDDEECGVGKVMLEIEIKKESKKKFIDEYGAAVSENMIIPG
jgi:pyruvate/2-oxoglutarate dehydrogenase complex dihydrolipoamide acyltransferase (E2) component